MASIYPSISALLPPELTPESVPSVDEAVDLLSLCSTTGRLLHGSSRDGWLAWAVRTIATRCVVSHLEFLYCEPWTAPEGCYVALLKEPEIDLAMDSISWVLARAESHPAELAELLQCGCVKSILEDLHKEQPSLNPGQGEAAPYLFRFLKSFYVFCEAAKSTNHAVLYTQWDGG